MSVIKYIGRTTDFKGKPLWEILGNLKNFGVGRIVVRSMFERYPEPSFLKILKVEAMPNEEIRKVKVTAEKTFRGLKYPKPVTICSTSYKADYRLIPKDEEADYCRVSSVRSMTILPRTMELPPLLREFVTDATGEKDPKIKVHFKPTRDKLARLAEEGEAPTVNLTMKLIKPISSQLYENIQQ